MVVENFNSGILVEPIHSNSVGFFKNRSLGKLHRWHSTHTGHWSHHTWLELRNLLLVHLVHHLHLNIILGGSLELYIYIDVNSFTEL